MGTSTETVAVVTGAAHGIGRATAIHLSRAGYSVVVVDVDETPGRAVCSAIRVEGGRAMFVKCDVTDEDQITTMMAKAESLGHLCILVNNAGVDVRGTVETCTLEQWDRILRINLTSAFLCTRAAIPRLRRHGGGVVINVASVHALRTMENYAAYAASKAGLVGLTQSIALDYAADGIRAMAVLPGATRTRLLDQDLVHSGFDADQAIAQTATRFPLKRIAEPEEIAAVIGFLASSGASFMTGCAIPVDGGISSRLPPEVRASKG